MNPFLAAIMGTLLHLKRKCPKCKREQVVKASEKQKTIVCKFCGAKIPPKRMDQE
jgi:ribosomal protein S27E